MMVPPELYALRSELMGAFNSENFYYYNASPQKYNGFIDGMAWVGLMAGSARLLGDHELAEIGEEYLKRILIVGEYARTYAPEIVDADWKESKSMPGFWYKEKRQSFAGPAGLEFARQNGADISETLIPRYFNAIGKARSLTRWGWLFGHCVKWFGFLEQHINSMFLAYLILGKTPPSSMRWLAYDNPFYAFIYGEKLKTQYPDPRPYKKGETLERADPVPLSKRKPSAWVFRLDPRKEYVDESGAGRASKKYTRIWELVAEYLQSTLE